MRIPIIYGFRQQTLAFLEGMSRKLGKGDQIITVHIEAKAACPWLNTNHMSLQYFKYIRHKV